MMEKLLLKGSLLLLYFSLTGCSVYKAASQPGPADLSGIGVGTPRQIIISRLGAPKMIDTDAKGYKQDIFEFSSGMHQATKVRVVLYLAADVFTLTLAELLLWPLEMTLLESATCTGIATYDLNLKVQSWSVEDKKDTAQSC
jgi:hypothetical protein